jgi:5'-nucleotidase/2',3'-cyclic-nucleotide 2'-phosphodiesterase/3'-nucleotidase/5'-nucleotidase
LGEFDPMVQEIADATLRAIEQGKRNASLDVNGIHIGRLSLAGHLASNLVASTATVFVDVPHDHPFHEEIEALYQAGYVAGCNIDPLMYCPDAAMTRAESAVFVERGIHGARYLPAQPTSQVFDDVLLWEWFAKWADGLWEDGYTAGCGVDPMIYCPMQEHTRTEGAVFFLRMLRGVDFVPPDPVGLFIDVPLDFWGAKWIEAAFNAGLIPACETSPDLRFCPDDPLDRSMAAYMMVQAKGLDVP